MRLRSLFLTLLLWGAGPVPRLWAQPAPAPDSVRVLALPSLVAATLAGNHHLHAALLEAEARATRPAQVGALPDPSLMVGYRPLAIGGVSGVVPSQLMLQQMIPYPGKRGLAAEAARLEAAAAGAEAEALALDLRRDVQDAYYELYRIQEQEALVEAFLARLRDFEEAAAVRYEVGRGPQQAILKAQVERLALTRRVLELTAERRAQLERLARLTNLSDLGAGRWRVELAPPDLAPPVDTTLARALAQRPEVEALRLRAQQADAEVALAEQAYRPDFMLGVGFMDRMQMDARVRPLRDLDGRFSIQAGLALPLQRAPKAAAVAEARLRRDQIEAHLAGLETEVRTEIRELEARLREDARALALYREALLPQAETAVASTLTAYTTGQVDFLDLLDAERMRYELRMSYEETLARYGQARAALERVVGLARPLTAATEPN